MTPTQMEDALKARETWEKEENFLPKESDMTIEALELVAEEMDDMDYMKLVLIDLFSQTCLS